MSWYYAESGQQRGPVTDAELNGLVQAGSIRDDTLVWREGMADWQAYGKVRGEGRAAAPPLMGAILCSQCGKSFSADDVVRIGEGWVCGACKPAFLQRLREGAAPVPTAVGVISAAELLARDYQVEIGAYFSRAWNLFTTNAGIMIGASILVYLVLVVVNLIPYLKIILSLLLTGPLFGGLWLFYAKQARGEKAGIDDAFSGFGPRFAQLLLASVVSTVLMYLCFMPAAVVFGIGVAAGGSRGGARGLDSVGPVLLAVIGLVGLVGFCAFVYLSVSWLFTFPLVADKGLNFWSGMQLSRQMVAKHWWATLWLAIVCGVFGAIGALFCLVGALVSGPVAFTMLALHYQRVFGDLAPASEAV